MGGKLKGNQNKILSAISKILKDEFDFPRTRLVRYMNDDDFVSEVITFYNEIA